MAAGDKVKAVNNQITVKIGGAFIGGAENVNWKRSTPPEDVTTLADTATRRDPSPLGPDVTCDTDGFLIESDPALEAAKTAQKNGTKAEVTYIEGNATPEVVTMVISELSASAARGKYGKYKLSMASDGAIS